MVRGLSILIFAVLLTSCGEAATIDASSDEKLKTSIAKVRSSLPEERRSVFDESLKVLMFSQVDMKSVMAGSGGSALAESKMKGVLAGKTADQVISEADRIISERREKERQQALAEISELEQKQAESLKQKEALKRVEVLRSRFYVQKGSFRDEPVIELTVRNGLDSAISRIYFEGILASPDRSVPWVRDDFNYKISGGLEPGEEQSWKLAPNMFSDWGTRQYPDDAILTVFVLRVDGPDEESLFSSGDFTERDMSRLNDLKKRYGVE